MKNHLYIQKKKTETSKKNIYRSSGSETKGKNEETQFTQRKCTKTIQATPTDIVQRKKAIRISMGGGGRTRNHSTQTCNTDNADMWRTGNTRYPKLFSVLSTSPTCILFLDGLTPFRRFPISVSSISTTFLVPQ